MTDPADEAEALAALLASPCPSWCDSDEGHNWVDDGREGYVRSHARVIGAFTVFAAEYLRPDGTIQTDTPAIESHLPDRRSDHQNRQQGPGAVLQHDPPRREPQIALGRVPGLPREPVRRIHRPMLRPKPGPFYRNQDTEPVQPTRSASTDAGMSGNSDNNSRTLGSNTANDVSAGLRAYFGGAWEATALTTVVREIPNLAAIRAFGTPSAASLLINAQSSKVITLHRG